MKMWMLLRSESSTEMFAVGHGFPPLPKGIPIWESCAGGSLAERSATYWVLSPKCMDKPIGYLIGNIEAHEHLGISWIAAETL